MNTSQDRKASVRQNGTYTSSRKHEVNLRRNSTVHFQIGLIVVLLVTIFLVELRTQHKTYAEIAPFEEETPTWIGEITREVKEIPKEVPKETQVVQTPTEPDELKVVKDDAKLIESFLPPTKPNPNAKIVDPDNVSYVPDEETPESVPFILVEDVPIFPGCEREKTNKARRDCMNSKINKFVRKKFNTGKADGLGLEGLNRINTLFVIDKTGVIVDVQIRAPHPKLEKEARRVLGLLPDMTPGKQRNEPVKVQFALPIVFKVED